MIVEFHPLPSANVAAIRASGFDAYDNPVERAVSSGSGTPCRHCLQNVPEGEEYLILAHRPFDSRNPYAETGPIFLCASDCTAPGPSPHVPDILGAPHHILRGYSADERIVYGTGQVVPTSEIPDRAARLLSQDGIAFADVRSASNNCFLCRIRAQA